MKPVWLLAAVALAVFLVVRRRRLEPTLLIGGALAVVGLGVYGSGVVHFPNLQKALEDLGRNLGAWTYGSWRSPPSWRPARSSASWRRARP
jgi:undecaprenyl-diphosphatase